MNTSSDLCFQLNLADSPEGVAVFWVMANTTEPVPVGEEPLGCKHYKRKCAFVSPCCEKIYACRVCHDDEENHSLDRYAVKEVECSVCKLRQKAQKECEGCNIVFGLYYCAVCHLFDDEDKKQFHCEGCGLCRIGGRENFYHCPKCDMCLANSLKGAHKCVEKASRSHCPVCLEDLHTSREGVEIPRCGHVIHSACIAQLFKTGNSACPLCNESLADMKKVWEMLDVELENTPMPEEYKDFKVWILCRDCHKESQVLFHIVGLKCLKCGSYNTCRTAGKSDDEKEEDMEADESPGASSASAATALVAEIVEETSLPTGDQPTTNSQTSDSATPTTDCTNDSDLSHV